MKNTVTKYVKKVATKPVVKSTTKSNSTKKKAVATKKSVSSSVKNKSNVLVLEKPTTIRYGKYTVKVGKNGITLI